jgi:D-aspartate ligase
VNFRIELKPKSNKPAALIMNLFYTGLGIARNLGIHDIPVISLVSKNESPGRFTKYGQVLACPDSKDNPRELCDFLLQLGPRLPTGSIIFPTRDADILFLDHYHEALKSHFVIPQPPSNILGTILNKQALANISGQFGVLSPRTFTVTSEESLLQIQGKIDFPSLIKPIRADEWRSPEVWCRVGRVKAICAESFEMLLREYRRISSLCPSVLVQSLVPGNEEDFYIFGAYFDRSSECRGSFTAQKVIQYPPGVGTGCMVRIVDRPEVADLGTRLLAGLKFSGIAEVEFKYNKAHREYRLIEINPRHWDQHRLGTLCGVNLSLIAYQDLCGEKPVPLHGRHPNAAWIAEADFARCLAGDLIKRRKPISGIFKLLFSLIRGKRVFGTFSWADPMPFINSIFRGPWLSRS